MNEQYVIPDKPIQTLTNEEIPFTHLHLHTEYSLLDGSNKIKEAMKQIKALGMDSIAITDHGVMFGVIDFYLEAKKNNIKPIIGCEVYVASRSRTDKESGIDNVYNHLILLAENQTGYQNLMKLVSFGFTEGFYYKPRIDMALLAENSEGLIALSACLGGQIPTAIMNNQLDMAKELALKYKTIMGPNNFFLELQDHGIEEQKTVNEVLIKMSEELDIPLVATNDVHYTYADDVQSHDILLCIQTNKKVSDPDRMRYTGGQFYLKSPKEMLELFQNQKEAILNTRRIAERCNVEFEFGQLKLPKFDLPAGKTAMGYLKELCYIGLEERYPVITEELKDRMDFELSVIGEMGFVDYFLITWDFIKFARDNDIIVGPGRGSAAGSIVSYALKITNIDPIKYNLLFERFLNPDRVSMPDIDIDFCYERRQEVIDYVIAKYGSDKVAQIITFGTMAARAVIRDVGRAIDMPYADVDKVAKMIPQELKITIEKALKINSELRHMYEEDDRIKFLIDMSMRLEGLPRHSSTHAAGVVVCDRPVYEYVPLNTNDEAVTTQFPMNTLEQLGLLKMDFLGLRTLTVIQNAVKQIKANRGIDIDIEKIDLEDEATFELISSAKTEGVFQLESEGMKSFMKDLKPRTIEDVIAGVSLYRPGPMDFIPTYIKGKKNADSIVYDCDELIPILEPTYGCIVYQEQVMQIVRDLAGYTLGRSDLMRRAMSKKKADVMEQEKRNFVYGNEAEGVPGCIKRGIKESVALKIYEDMNSFAQYAFNKSHAAAYAIIAYQTAWLKNYYPVEFMAALLTSVMDNSNKVSEYIGTLKTMKIQLAPPDINKGYERFTVNDDVIRFSLAAVKNVGRGAVKDIVSEREKMGPFKSMTDFCLRMAEYGVNKRMLENLISAGSFDSFGGTRMQYMQAYKGILDGVIHEKKHVIAGQVDLFSMGSEEKSLDDRLPDVGEFMTEQLLSNEKEVLGVYLSGHPLEKYEELWSRNISHKSLDFAFEDENGVTKHFLREREPAIIGGIIVDKTIKTIRNDKQMAFIQIEDIYGTVEVIIFPKEFDKNRHLLNIESKIFIKGQVSLQEDQDAKLICSRIMTFEEQMKLSKDKIQASRVDIWFENYEDYKYNEKNLAEIIAQNPGKLSVRLVLAQEKQVKDMGTSNGIQANEQVIRRLKERFGDKKVKVIGVAD